jgi:hypothetical protein
VCVRTGFRNVIFKSKSELSLVDIHVCVAEHMLTFWPISINIVMCTEKDRRFVLWNKC